MRISFVYADGGFVYPACIIATHIYYDPEDSTLCISDGISWWDIVMTERRAKDWIRSAFKSDSISFPDACIFRVVK